MMTDADILELLKAVQAGDNRNITEEMIGVWSKVFARNPRIDLHDALESLNIHRSESADWVMPANIVVNVRRVWAERERDRARHTAIEARRTDGRIVVPWWFKKLVMAETEKFRKIRKDQGRWEIESIGIRNGAELIPGEEMTIEDKLRAYHITREPGDEAASLVLAMSQVESVKPPLPKLGSFLRDPENPRPTEEFGA